MRNGEFEGRVIQSLNESESLKVSRNGHSIRDGKSRHRKFRAPLPDLLAGVISRLENGWVRCVNQC